MNKDISSRQIFSITFEEYVGCRRSGEFSEIENGTTVDNHQIKLMSHFCLNGSLSYLTQHDWEQYCHPYHEEYHKNFDGINMLAGVWGIITFIIGAIGNLLTLIAIPYAKWKHRYDFHTTFYKTDIWVLHLAFCDFMWCIFCLPYGFLIPSFRWQYPQYPGSDTYCRNSLIIGYLTMTTDWLLLAFIAATRAIQIKVPYQWSMFCRSKLNILLLLLAPWILAVLILLPVFADPATDFGYHCLIGKCTIIPTGKESLKLLLEYPWLKNVWPISISFLMPFTIIGISYLIIWCHIKKTYDARKEITAKETEGNNGLNETQIKFIWTIFIVCIFYFICAGGMTYARFMRFSKKDSPFVVFVTSTSFLVQFCVNFFVYFYRSKAYRKAYWDIIVLILPCIEKNSRIKKILGLTSLEEMPSKSIKTTNQLSRKLSI